MQGIIFFREKKKENIFTEETAMCLEKDTYQGTEENEERFRLTTTVWLQSLQ